MPFERKTRTYIDASRVDPEKDRVKVTLDDDSVIYLALLSRERGRFRLVFDRQRSDETHFDEIVDQVWRKRFARPVDRHEAEIRRRLLEGMYIECRDDGAGTPEAGGSFHGSFVYDGSGSEWLLLSNKIASVDFVTLPLQT